MVLVPSDNSKPKKRRSLPKQTEIVKREAIKEDHFEAALRPRTLQDYIGQEDLRSNLDIAIQAAKKRKESLEHLLFYGPPGLGKTTLSMLIAVAMGTTIKITSAPALERPRDIAGILVTLQPGDVLFIDEIHRLNKVTEEILYPAMEDFSLDITIGKGQSARIKRLPLKRFTLIGATTRAGSLSSPLRARFGHVHRLNFYQPEELAKIIIKSAEILKLPLSATGALAIAQCSRGTPRVANRLLKRVRDYAEVKDITEVDETTAQHALNLLQIDEMGLDPTDRLILELIIKNYNGGPVGIETIAAAISEDVTTLEDVYEPFLMQIGFLNRTPRGRVVTPKGFEHLGYKTQLSIFEDM